MHLRDYGYNTKANFDSRLNAIKYAIDENDAQVVYERLVKLGKFNPVMKEDAESVARIYEVNVEEKTVVEAEAEATVEASAEASAEAEPEVMEEKVLFLEMLDTKLANYKRQLSNMLDNEDLDNNCILAFDKLRENMVAAYDEKIMKNKKIMEQKLEDFHKITINIDKYRNKLVGISKDYDYKRYTLLRDMLFEMSKEEEPVLQDIKQFIVAVLKEHKQCDIVKVSELEREYQHVLHEARRLMKEIEEQVSRKSVAIKKCDLEGYDILTSSILENYKKVFATNISALILELRVKEAKHSISEIPSPYLFQ